MSKRVDISTAYYATHELVGKGVVSEGALFIGNILLATNDSHLRAFRLKPQVPRKLANVLDNPIPNGTFADYLHEAHDAGSPLSIGQIFTEGNFHIDCDEIELDGHNFQPKLDVLTERFDALDLVNALDQELVDEFVAQLSAGGDAFALIDAKVLVETQRAQQAEGVVSSALAQEVTDRGDADAILQNNIDAVQLDVDNNETTAAQATSDEQVRALAAEGVIAGNLAQEIVDRGTAVSGEASARAAAIQQEVSNRNSAIATAVADLIDSAPGALDTLKDLADALGNDDEFSATITGLINAKQDQLTHGIADGNTLEVDGSGAAAGDFMRFTLTGVEPRPLAGFKSDLTLVKADVGLASVEDTALSTWAGSSAVSALGTVTTGEWKATAVADAYVASAATWNAKQDDLTVHEQSVVDAQPFTTTYKQNVDDNNDKISYSTAASDQVAANVVAIAGKQEQLTHGIADGNTLKVDGVGAAAGRHVRFTASGLESRTLSNYKSDLSLVSADVGLGNVENTALSGWTGSGNVVQVGNVASGQWQATAVADQYIASAATWNAKQDDLTVHEQSVVDAQPFTAAYKQDVDDNKDKISYSAAASSQVAANVLAIADNTAKRTNGQNDARFALASLVTTHAGYHVSHTSDIAAKSDKNDGVHTGDSHFQNIGVDTATPSSKFHVAYTANDDKCAWIGQGTSITGTSQDDLEHRTLILGSRPSGAWSSLGFQVQASDKASIQYNQGLLEFFVYDSASSAWDVALQLRKDGGVFLPNLPTSPSGLAVGQLYSDSGTIKITLV